MDVLIIIAIIIGFSLLWHIRYIDLEDLEKTNEEPLAMNEDSSSNFIYYLAKYKNAELEIEELQRAYNDSQKEISILKRKNRRLQNELTNRKN